VFLSIDNPSQSELPEIAQTDRTLALFSGAAQHRNEQRYQERDNCNHDQQLDNGEGSEFSHGG
jgi:hypothetical protein